MRVRPVNKGDDPTFLVSEAALRSADVALRDTPGWLLDVGGGAGQLNGLHDEITTIPVGPQGPPGPKGDQGDQGAPGAAGAPGEVTAQQLSDGLATTANNPSGFAPYGGSFSNPPTQAQMEDFAAYVEAFRQTLVR